MYYFTGIILLLGILVFIHEFGHFYVAKLCGMKVKTFSIGMGPKLFKFTRGETEYALSLIPFGGYVNIMGQDPQEDVPEEEKHRSFSRMSLLKRFAVVIAGPAANFILTFFVFWLLFSKGFLSPSATIHFVHPNSPAAQAGVVAGDKVLSIQSAQFQQNVRELSDLQRFLKTSKEESFQLKIEREGKVLDLSLQGELGKMSDSLTGIDRESVTLPGIEFQSYPPIFSAHKKSELLKKYPKSFFIVESYKTGEAKTDIDSIYQLEKAWKQSIEQKQNLSLIVHFLDAKNEKETGPETIEIGIPPSKDLNAYGFIPAHLMLTQILEGSAASKLGLQKGDIIKELNKQPIWTFNQFKNRLQEVAASHESLNLKWIRDGQLKEGSFTPQYVENENPITQVKEKKFQLGAMFVGIGEASFEKVKAKGFVDGIQLAAMKTWNMSAAILESFVFLATGKVSMKAMGGPVMIGKIAGESLKLGFDTFMKMLAFISLNLCILNLMPLPVLDGGHIVLFAIEGIIRRPIPYKIIEGWATVGAFMLIGLALFVTFNDLSKLNVISNTLKIFGK